MSQRTPEPRRRRKKKIQPARPSWVRLVQTEMKNSQSAGQRFCTLRNGRNTAVDHVSTCWDFLPQPQQQTGVSPDKQGSPHLTAPRSSCKGRTRTFSSSTACAGPNQREYQANNGPFCSSVAAAISSLLCRRIHSQSNCTPGAIGPWGNLGLCSAASTTRGA